MDAQQKMEEGVEIADYVSSRMVSKDQVREIVKEIIEELSN